MSIRQATPEEWLAGVQCWIVTDSGYSIAVERISMGTYFAPTTWLPVTSPEPPSEWMRKVCEQAQNTPRSNAYTPGVRL